MNSKLVLILITFIIAAIPVVSTGQVIPSKDPFVISSSGGRHQNNYIVLEWTLGEAFVSSNFIQQKMITEGFHQSWLYTKNIPSLQSPSDHYKITLAPNPTDGLLKINIQTNEKNELQLKMIDVAGKLILKQNISPGVQDVELQVNHFAEGIYLLSITSEKGYRIYSSKVIKL